MADVAESAERDRARPPGFRSQQSFVSVLVSFGGFFLTDKAPLEKVIAV